MHVVVPLLGGLEFVVSEVSDLLDAAEELVDLLPIDLVSK